METINGALIDNSDNIKETTTLLGNKIKQQDENLINCFKSETMGTKCLLQFPLNLSKVSECMVVQIEKLDNFLAGGYSSGHIIIHDLNTSQVTKIIRNVKDEYPDYSAAITSLRWKPHEMSVEKNILLSINVEGEITYWHTLTGKKLHQIQENQFTPLSLDYNKEGSLFAVGSDDKSVRIYDENMRIVTIKIPPGGFYSSGHIGRVNSICFHKKDDTGIYSNILATGGGDQRVMLYDIRAKKIINTISGPYIASDSVDLKNHYLLTGSYNKNGEVQLWDLRTFKIFKDLTQESENSSYIQSVQFSSKNYLASGSGHSHSLKIYKFDCSKDDYEITNINPYMLTKTLEKPCYSIHFSHKEKFVAFGGGSDYYIRVINL